MSAVLLAEASGASVYHATWTELLDVVPGCDLLFADTPYSERTHAGHDAAVSPSRLDGEEERTRTDRRTGTVYSVGVNRRRVISYQPWTAADVAAFVEAWHPRTRGWFVSVTDHVLAPAWAAALEAAGRYVFAPFPYVDPGSRVRMSGDGPALWAVWVVVARPATAEMAKWGALPGAYVTPPGQSVDLPVVGGKQPWFAQKIVEHYSRPGGLVCDPTCGAGTTAAVAIRTGRRAIVGDMDRTHADLAALWIKHPHRPAPTAKPLRVKPGQVVMFPPTAPASPALPLSIVLPPPEAMNGYADSCSDVGPSGFTEPDHYSAPAAWAELQAELRKERGEE